MDMGIVKHKDVFSSKYNTAVIIDSGLRAQFIPIKFVIGDFFLVKMQNLLYCFKIEENRMITYRETLTKSCHFFIYSTDNWLPFSPNDVTELETILTKNSLPKVDRNLLKSFQILGRKEDNEFKEHDLVELAAEIALHEKEYPEEVEQMVAFFEHLAPKKIVTPLKKVSEFLVEELITTHPQFMGSVVTNAIQVEEKHKKVTNEPVTGKAPWLKMVAIFMLIGIVAGLGYYAYSSGAFDHLIPQIGGGQTTQGSIMAEYPDPAKLKQAIADGKVNYNDLPKDVQKLVDNTKLPPKPLAPNQH